MGPDALSDDQINEIVRIVRVGREMDQSDAVIEAGLLVAYSESSFRPAASNSVSTAEGLFQYLDDSYDTGWNRLQRDFPDNPYITENRQDYRSDADVQTRMFMTEASIYADGYPQVINQNYQAGVDRLVALGHDPASNLDEYIYYRHNTSVEQTDGVLTNNFTDTNRAFATQYREAVERLMDDPNRTTAITAEDVKNEINSPTIAIEDSPLSFNTGNETVELLLANLNNAMDNQKGFDENVIMASLDTKEGKSFMDNIDSRVEQMKIAETSIEQNLSKSPSVKIG